MPKRSSLVATGAGISPPSVPMTYIGSPVLSLSR
jgi:hypothetical protein